MQTELIRMRIAQAIGHEQATGMLGQMLMQASFVQGNPAPPAAIAQMVGAVREYVERVPVMLEALAAFAVRAGVTPEELGPLAQTVDEYFLEPYDLLPDAAGLGGIVDDAYLACGLVQAMGGDTPQMIERHQFIRGLIGEPFASQLDAICHMALSTPNLQQANSKMAALAARERTPPGGPTFAPAPPAPPEPPPSAPPLPPEVHRKSRTPAEFDVFLCHNSVDKPAVKVIGQRLLQQGLTVWLDEWNLRPGFPWVRVLEEQIGSIKSAAVFIGAEGMGPWQKQELEAFLREFVERQCPVIPVLLVSAAGEPELPRFLKGNTYVDFRRPDPDPLDQLMFGITGHRRRRR